MDPATRSFGGKSTNVGGGGGDFMDRAQAYKKEKNSQLLHATRGVFSYMNECEYWLSLLSIDRSISSMGNLNHRRIAADL